MGDLQLGHYPHVRNLFQRLRGGEEKEGHKGKENIYILFMVSSGPEVLLTYGESEEEIALHCEKLNNNVGQRAGIRAPSRNERKGLRGRKGRQRRRKRAMEPFKIEDCVGSSVNEYFPL